ncbi:MAG: NRDE family protein [Balneolaceae bacterium]
MCLIAFAYKTHPVYELVFAANRDEFYSRPTRPAKFWGTDPDMLAGKDLEAGGTWMGINTLGEFAAVTNFRDMSNVMNNVPTRGKLVTEYLIRPENTETYLQQIHKDAGRYNGFNLLAGTVDRLWYYSNAKRNITAVDPGIHGLSNHLLNTSWVKVERARQALATELKKEMITGEELFELLKDDRPAPDDALPDTGLTFEIEKAVSPVFIKTEKYGTRCSTILLIDKQGHVTFEERCYLSGTTELKEKNRYDFQIKLR